MPHPLSSPSIILNGGSTLNATAKSTGNTTYSGGIVGHANSTLSAVSATVTEGSTLNVDAPCGKSTAYAGGLVAYSTGTKPEVGPLNLTAEDSTVSVSASIDTAEDTAGRSLAGGLAGMIEKGDTILQGSEWSLDEKNSAITVSSASKPYSQINNGSFAGGLLAYENIYNMTTKLALNADGGTVDVGAYSVSDAAESDNPSYHHQKTKAGGIVGYMTGNATYLADPSLVASNNANISITADSSNKKNGGFSRAGGIVGYHEAKTINEWTSEVVSVSDTSRVTIKSDIVYPTICGRSFHYNSVGNSPTGNDCGNQESHKTLESLNITPLESNAYKDWSYHASSIIDGRIYKNATDETGAVEDKGSFTIVSNNDVLNVGYFEFTGQNADQLYGSVAYTVGGGAPKLNNATLPALVVDGGDPAGSIVDAAYGILFEAGTAGWTPDGNYEQTPQKVTYQGKEYAFYRLLPEVYTDTAASAEKWTVKTGEDATYAFDVNQNFGAAV